MELKTSNALCISRTFPTVNFFGTPCRLLNTVCLHGIKVPAHRVKKMISFVTLHVGIITKEFLPTGFNKEAFIGI